MAFSIRQEINILDANIAAAAADTTANEIVQIDTTQYSGTVLYYFEVECSKTAGDSVTIALRRTGTSTDDATIASASIPTTLGLVRSAAFTPLAGATGYTVFIDWTSGTGARVKAARIIVIQSGTTLTNTETQIEIGNASATTTTTDTALTNPKYWQYTGANWDGTITVYFEGVFATSTNKSAATMTLQTSTAIDAPSWSNVASSAVTTTGTVATRVRSAAITLVAGNWYQAVMKAGNSKSGITVYRAGIVVDQSNQGYNLGSAPGGNKSIEGGTANLREAIAQGFIPGNSDSITGIKLWLKKVGSPVDNLTCDLVTSLGGSSLATVTIAASSLTTSYVETTLTFVTPYTVAAGTTYYFQLTRSGGNDASNACAAGQTGQNYPPANAWQRNSNVWSDNSSDLDFTVLGITGITKLEPQYLLANTLFAAGTSLQTFLTKWDSTEFDDGAGTTGFTFQAEAANGSTSDVTLNTAAGTLVTGSTLTNIDNAQISGALTMPADGNLDTIATGNAGDVAAARILVAYVFAADVAAAVVPSGEEYSIITS
jgi:hypothetical protein